MALLKLSSKRFLGVVKEASYGVPVTTGERWLPVKNPKVTPKTKFEIDNALRGLGAMDFGAYAGVQSCDFSYTLPWFVTDTPEILTSILGPDTVTGTVAPYTHTFNMATAEPSSLTLMDYDVIDQYEIAGGMISDASFKIDAEGAVTCDIKGSGFYPSTVSTSSPSYETNPYYLGWQGALTMNSTSNNNLVSATIDMKRKLTPRWAVNNSQQLRFAWVGPLSVSVKATFDVTDDTEYNLFANNTQGNFQLTFTDPATTNTLEFNIPKLAFTTGEKVSGKDWMQTDISGTAIYQSSANGPLQVIVTNGQSAAY